ncbi:hypothetical protein TOPH_02521 [Tolypocladium ophioglossoides CBS 100239]|uniref:Uncharacterized protein n=1 Tax=Tolypocladium ophioglossoides (strain CBS 100239) TaxID=1163406 RepID=A0A0L0NFU2_TOLOC|nr:hypothetical protein TOPH_02521 [Tolypocladium ophioglossoides CBS 100239]
MTSGSNAGDDLLDEWNLALSSRTCVMTVDDGPKESPAMYLRGAGFAEVLVSLARAPRRRPALPSTLGRCEGGTERLSPCSACTALNIATRPCGCFCGVLVGNTL